MAFNTVSDVLTQLHRQQEVERAAHEQEAARCRGVHYAGCDISPFRPKSESELQEQAKARAAQIEAFRASPRGRLLRALKGLEDCGAYHAEVYAVRGIYNRSISDEREAVNAEAVGRAIRILAEIVSADARAGIAALADLLAPQLSEAA